MRTLVIYESMYGNTHAIAEEIASGLQSLGEIRVVPVREAADDLVAWADLLIVGGPTHAHGMSRSTSRKDARTAAAKPESQLTLDPGAEGPGIRDWIGLLGDGHGKRAAAFDTRVDAPAVLTGRASVGIAKELQRRRFILATTPESFLVNRHNRLVEGEADRAMRWAADLAAALATAS